MKFHLTLAAIVAIGFSSPAMAEDCAEDQRLIKHHYGTTCIPENAERIVSTVSSVTVPLIELGIMPVGSTGGLDSNGQQYLRSSLNLTGVDFPNSDMMFLGLPNQLDFEAITAAKPDLILHGVWGSIDSIENYERLSMIAPTIGVHIQKTTGIDLHAFVAEATGTQSKLKAIRELYDAQIAQLKRMAPEGLTVAVMQGYKGSLLLFHTYPGMGQVLRDAGFKFPDLIEEIEVGSRKSISAEYLQELDVDWIVTSYRNDRGQTPADAIAALEEVLPNWCEALTACREGRVIYLPRDEAAAGSIMGSVATIYALTTHLSDPARQLSK
ncbi:MAG: ABC transporter substrate-binding protein [Alphaproteobacteria bacterium]|nr:ABC transporter substrate-binding protein [Alphaproteobacteria bacterium]